MTVFVLSILYGQIVIPTVIFAMFATSRNIAASWTVGENFFHLIGRIPDGSEFCTVQSFVLSAIKTQGAGVARIVDARHSEVAGW